MSNPIAAAVLGVVEGITEFLPISSTGHLIVASELLNFEDTEGAFEIAIQAGAVLAVLWFYRKDLIRQARQLPVDGLTRRFWLSIILAFLPAGIVGFFLSDYITEVLFNPQVVAASLIVGGIALWIIESVPRKSSDQEMTHLMPRQALLIGLAQTTALIPGVSRSAATIIGGMLVGLSRPVATTFSFYLALPTLGTATVYSLVKDLDAMRGDILGDLAIGLAVSFVVSLLAIRWLLSYISVNDFKGFAIYRVVAGIAILLFFKFVE